jgi:hypothetical protein
VFGGDVKARVEKPSGFELYHRAAKVEAMLEQADKEALSGGVDPFRCSLAVAAAWSLAKREHFLELARKAKVREPSEETIAAFLERLKGRAAA